MLLNQCTIFMFMFLVDGKCLGHLDESQNTAHQQDNLCEMCYTKCCEGMIKKIYIFCLVRLTF